LLGFGFYIFAQWNLPPIDWLCGSPVDPMR
jgi:hypothetical protein